MGSGKTLTAVTAAQCFIDDNPKGHVIVVTPTSLQENFKKEMLAYGADPEDYHYEFLTLQRFANVYAKKKCPPNTMLIIDEAHNLRTEPKEGTRSHVAIKISKSAKKVLLLTATGIYNEPRDLANLVAMAKGIKLPTQKEFEGILESPAKFKKFFGCVLSFYEIPKDENYPTLTEHYVEIPMTSAYYKQYRGVENKNSEFFNKSNPWRFLTGVRQASNKLKSCIKCDWVLNKAKEGGKMVIFSSFLTYGVKEMQARFKKARIPFVEVTGIMSKKKRGEAVKRYNSNEVRIMFITKAGGEGLDLKATRSVVIFESSWNRATEEQVIGRAVRYLSHAALPAKDRTVDAYHLVITKPKERKKGDEWESADTYLQQIIQRKETVKKEFLKGLYPLSIEQARTSGCK